MSKHTVKSLSSHLLSGWSTVEKGSLQVCSPSLATEILSHADSNVLLQSSISPLSDNRNESTQVSVSPHVAARLIIMITSKGNVREILPAIASFLKSQSSSLSSWPVAVACTCIPMNELEISVPGLLDPYESLMNRLSSIEISPKVFEEDPSFATPLELIAVGLCVSDKDANLNGHNRNNIERQHDHDIGDDDDDNGNDLDVDLVPLQTTTHYTPNINLPDRLDYLVILGLKEPPKRQTTPIPRKPTPRVTSSAGLSRSIFRLSTARSSTPNLIPHPSQSSDLITLGSHGRHAGPPDLCRTRLNGEKFTNQNGRNPSTSLQNLPSVHLSQKRRHNVPPIDGEVVDLIDSDPPTPDAPVPASKPIATATGTVVSRSVLSPNQLSTDNEVQIIDNSDAGMSSKSPPNLNEDEDEDEDEVQFVQKKPSCNVNQFRKKLHSRKREALEKQKVVAESEMPLPSTLPDTHFAKKKMRGIRKDLREKKRKEAQFKEESRKRRKIDKKKQRLEDSKDAKQADREDDFINNDDDDDDDDDGISDEINSRRTSRRPRSFRSNDLVLLNEEEYRPERRHRTGNGYGHQQQSPSRTREQNKNGRVTRSMSNSHATRSPNARSSRVNEMSAVELLEHERDRLFKTIEGHMWNLSMGGRDKIDDFLKGKDYMFEGNADSFDLLLHRNCSNGLDHVLRLRRHPTRTWEDIRVAPP